MGPDGKPVSEIYQTKTRGAHGPDGKKITVKKEQNQGSFGATAHDRPISLSPKFLKPSLVLPQKKLLPTGDFFPLTPAIPTMNPANNDPSGQKHQNTMANQQNNDELLMDSIDNLWNRTGLRNDLFEAEDDQSTPEVSNAEPLPPTNTEADLMKFLNGLFDDKTMLENEKQEDPEEQENPD